MKAIAVGPTNKSSRPSTPASAAARLTRVFLATEYVASAPSARRSSVRAPTDRPRYSVTTVAVELLNCSAISATAVTFSGFAILRLLSDVGSDPNYRPEVAIQQNAPDAERSGAQIGHTKRAEARVEYLPRLSLRGPPAAAGPSTEPRRERRPTVFGRTDWVAIEHVDNFASEYRVVRPSAKTGSHHPSRTVSTDRKSVAHITIDRQQ